MASNHAGGAASGEGGGGGAGQGEMVSSSTLSTPASIPPGDNNVWADASPLIAAACNDLQDGELVHGENFSLFASMSALEIMDPKMDSGIEGTGYSSIEEAIENGAAPIPLSSDPTINIQRTIDVMDHLFSCEATWHKGALLAQTVFSCIYLLKVERTSPHAILHSYCRIIRATCNVVISAVYDARTHEEEDLFVMSYGLPLKNEMDEKSLSILHSVEETIARQLRACKAQTSKKKQLEDIESLQNNPELEEEYCRAILCRLRFRKHFYHLLTSMRKPEGRGLELARKHIASCLSELDLMRKSEKFLKSQPHILFQENQESNYNTTASGLNPVGFDSSVNNRLLSPTPPRAAKILSWIDAVMYFEKLLHDLDVICAFSLDPTLENVLQFVVRFQKFKPDLVSRAHLQLLLVNSGKLFGRHFFHEVISKAILLPEIAKEKEFQTNEFVVQLSQLLLQLLKILCTNTSWQRRKLGKTLQDWSIISMQLELAYKKNFGDTLNSPNDESLDAKVSKRLLFWSQEQTYWTASRFLQLGFELELYNPSEFCMVYWYMSVVFIQLLEKIQVRSIASIDISKQKGKKKKDQRDVIFSPSVLLLQCYIYLSEGLAMTLAALRNEGNAFKMPNTFNTENERFIQHFELLQKAHIPEQVSFSTFHESTFTARISEVVQYDYFREIQRISVSLKGSFAGQPEKLSELRQIEQVAERNRIALNVINQLGAGNPSFRVSLDLSHHPYFAVLLVKRS
ncbi:hypothetical protein LUZ60_000874 [Juncus effusus]|nr:hypothetical protein LUZ60_000874 [Juncus effusus]